MTEQQAMTDTPQRLSLKRLTPLILAVAGAVALWATFVPCFLWIFLAAPYLEQIAARPRLSAAMQGISAAVVGVIANLTVWFTLHVLFRDITATKIGPLRLPSPDLSSLDPRALLLTALAALLMLALRLPILPSLALLAAGGIALGSL